MEFEEDEVDDEQIVDEDFIQEMKARYPQPLWTFLEQEQLVPDMQELFPNLTDYEEVRLHLDALIDMAIDKDLWARHPKKEAVARAPHLAILAFLSTYDLEPEHIKKLWTISLLADEHFIRNYAITKLMDDQTEASFVALRSLVEDSSRPLHERFRFLKQILFLLLDEEPLQMERLELVKTFLNRPQSSHKADNERQNIDLIWTLCKLFEEQSSDEFVELLPVIQEVYEENRVNTEDMPWTSVLAVFGDMTTPIDEVELSDITHLTCQDCGQFFSHTLRATAYYDPMAIYTDIVPDNDNIPEGYIGINPLWIPYPVACPFCQSVDTYLPTRRGKKLLFADFIRVERAIEENREYVSPYKQIPFVCLDEVSHPLESLEFCQKALAEHPDSAKLHIEYARFLYHAGQQEEAKTHLFTALESDPTEPGSYLGLAFLEEHNNNPEEELRWWLALHEQFPKFTIDQRDRNILKKKIDAALIRLRGNTYAVKILQPNVGRNEPCPCGSGQKYKKCCLNK